MSSRAALALFVASIVVLGPELAGCGNRQREHREPPRDARRAPRVIEPSPERVGPLPPYAIRADGVGPYKLGEKLSDLLEHLPSGPQIVLFEIPGVVHRNVIRAEDDTILIGGEQASTATFVAVVGPEVARTESGIHVGSSRDELIAALGLPVDDPERTRDPRLLAPSALPNLRAVIDGGRVAAIVVTAASARSQKVNECARPAATERAIGACLTPAGELVEINGDEVIIRSADRERTLATPPRFPGLVFAAPLRNPTESRDELVVITRTDEASARTWWIAAYRLEGTRLLRTVDPSQLYQLSSANARWIGADLREVELYLELTSRSDGIDVGGLLATHRGSRANAIGDVVVISPASVTRHRAKSAPPEPSAVTAPVTPPAPPAGHVMQNAGDAGIDAGDSGAAEAESSKP